MSGATFGSRLTRARWAAAGAVLVVLCAGLSGCLQRRIRVVTNPPGATVWLNDTEIGQGPTETAFTFFGGYDVRIAKEGYHTLTTTRDAVAPWYEYPGIDLIVVALPWTVETRLDWEFTLEPVIPGDPGARDALLERASAMRRELGADQPADPMGPPTPTEADGP
jgi:hypothetical protein